MLKWTLSKAKNGYVLHTHTDKDSYVFIFRTWDEVIKFLTDHPTLGGKEGAE